MAADLLIERRGDTLVATANAGEDNIYSPAMIRRLRDAIGDAAADPDMRFVRLAARGRAFCLGRGAPPPAGNGRPSPDALRALAESIVGLNELLQTTPLVVIAEVQGDAAGFGAGLVGNADVAVAADRARLCFPEILSGFAPSIVMSWLPANVARKRAFEMVATGAWIDAGTALRDGLLTEVVPADRLRARVDERIEELGRMSAPALRDVKTFLGRRRGMDIASAAHASVDALVVAALRDSTGGPGPSL
jgi:methylglutaconyl-CoA hydratase